MWVESQVNNCQIIGHERMHVGGCELLKFYIFVTEIDWTTIEMQIVFFLLPLNFSIPFSLLFLSITGTRNKCFILQVYNTLTRCERYSDLYSRSIYLNFYFSFTWSIVFRSTFFFCLQLSWRSNPRPLTYYPNPLLFDQT
jgi:hypothetical protein